MPIDIHVQWSFKQGVQVETSQARTIHHSRKLYIRGAEPRVGPRNTLWP